jgi:hypothetical protein
VDNADVRRVIRPHGYDTISTAMTRGRVVLDKTFGNYMIASEKVKSSRQSLCEEDNSVLFVLSEMTGYWYMTNTR